MTIDTIARWISSIPRGLVLPKRAVKFVITFFLGVAASIAAAFLYDHYVSPVRFFEFFDSSPFSIAMRQCYFVPDSKSRFLIFPTQPSRRIAPNAIRIQGFLSERIFVLKFDEIDRLYRDGLLRIYPSRYLFRVQSITEEREIITFSGQGIAGIDIDASSVEGTMIGFSPTGLEADLQFSKSSTFPVEGGKCSILNLIIIGDSS